MGVPKDAKAVSENIIGNLRDKAEVSVVRYTVKENEYQPLGLFSL